MYPVAPDESVKMLFTSGEEAITRKYPGEAASLLWETPDSLDRDRLQAVHFYFNYQGMAQQSFLEVGEDSEGSWSDDIRDDAFTGRVSSVGIPDQAEFGFQLQDFRLDTDHTDAGTYRCQYQEGLLDPPMLDALVQVLFLYGTYN